MSDSSADNEIKFFQGLRARNISALLNLVKNVGLGDESYLRNRYEQLATEFEATVRSLEHLGLLSRSLGSIHATPSLVSVDTTSSKFHWLCERILADSDGAAGLANYLSGFACTDGQLRREARMGPEPTDVRDALMDLGVVTYDHEAELYTLKEEYDYLHAVCLEAKQSQNTGRIFTPEQLQAVLRSRDEVALRAEEVVVGFEKERVGKNLESRVVHVAKENVAAGFDVLSVSLDDQRLVPRYIEVKAVSADDYGFFLTSNEIRVARLFGPCYFLYLVPVGADGAPQIDRLRMVNDPANQVLASDDWLVSPALLHCCLRT